MGKYAYTPKSRVEFWMKKFEQNIRTHEKAVAELSIQGWRVEVVWECELADLEGLKEKIGTVLQK